jgi:hypothetical protein
MILESLDMQPEAFHELSGWELRSEGACRGDRCVPLANIEAGAATVDVRAFAEALRMPVLSDDAHGVHVVGPESGGKVLESALCPDIVLPDLEGNDFAFSSLRGRKVVLVAWASW